MTPFTTPFQRRRWRAGLLDDCQCAGSARCSWRHESGACQSSALKPRLSAGLWPLLPARSATTGPTARRSAGNRPEPARQEGRQRHAGASLPGLRCGPACQTCHNSSSCTAVACSSTRGAASKNKHEDVAANVHNEPSNDISARSSSSRRTCTPAAPPQAPSCCCSNSTTTAAREVFDNSAKSVNVAANSYNVTSNNIGFEVLRGDEGLLHLGQARRVQQERQHQDNRRSGGEMDMAGGSDKAGCSGRWRSGVFL